MSVDHEQFYEEYWKRAESEGRIRQPGVGRYQARMYVAADLITEIASEVSGFQLLDAACGDGLLGGMLRQRLGDQVKMIGADVSGYGLKFAEPYYDQLVQADLGSEEALQEIPSGSLDLIVTLETLEHLVDPGAALRTFHRLLKKSKSGSPGGSLIASFPNIAWWKNRLDFLAGRFPEEYADFEKDAHFHHFSLGSFQALLEKHGFRSERIEGAWVGPSLLRPRRVFNRLYRLFPNFFGYQIIVVARHE